MAFIRNAFSFYQLHITTQLLILELFDKALAGRFYLYSTSSTGDENYGYIEESRDT